LKYPFKVDCEPETELRGAPGMLFPTGHFGELLVIAVTALAGGGANE
jgi:hypothetical protein